MTLPASADAREEPFFFASGSRALFGVLHRPTLTPADEAFVFCHPFGEEKLWTHRIFVLFARHMAARGYPVLRFDFMGNGDSEGDFSESSLSTARQDLQIAIERARLLTGAESVSLLGLRLGATIASLVAEDERGIGRLVLWAPIVDGDRYMQELLRINVTTQMAAFKAIRQERSDLVAAMRLGATVNVDGYEMAHAMYAEVAAVALGSQRRFPGRCLVVQIDRQERHSAELHRVAASYGNATLAFAQEEPFWKEIARSYQTAASNLFSVTSEWLSDR